MANFKSAQINPYNFYRGVGTQDVKSRYLPNDYYVEWTPSRWRMAMDYSINYSDHTFTDAMYSWCIESSPFLVSQINKRLNPITKSRFAFVSNDFDPDDDTLNINDFIDRELTKAITETNWWRKLVRSILLARFYGVKVVGIDIENDKFVDYPLRNIDTINQAIRYGTYTIEDIAYIKEYDNIFFIQPETDQDFRMGMMQPISRAMIGIVEAYNNWSVNNKSYSYPQTVVGYVDGNPKMKEIATDIANNFDPLTRPVLPFKQNLDDKRNVYQVEISPINTQSYPNGFEGFKQYIDMYRQEIMQLITGGTLLGATEKNTNSEQLANIHVSLYEEILEGDILWLESFFNTGDTRKKLATLLGIPELENLKVRKIPNNEITLDKFEKVCKALSQVGLQPTTSLFKKIGLEETDINTDIINSSWTDINLQKKTLKVKIKEVLSKITGNGDNRTTDKQPSDTSGTDSE